MVKTLITIFLFPLCLFAQTSTNYVPTYYHDSALDSIQNNEAYVDSAINNSTSSIPALTVQDQVIEAQSNLNNIVNFNLGANGSAYQTPSQLPFQFTDSQFAPVTNSGFGVNTLTNGQVLTNLSSTFSASIYSSFNSSNISLSGLTNTDLLDGSSNDPYAIVITNETRSGVYTMKFNYFSYSNLPSWLPPLVVSIVISIFWFRIFKWIVDDLNEEIKRTMNQRQIQGSFEAILGTNASAAVGAAYAATFTAIVVVAIGIVLNAAIFQQFSHLSSIVGVASAVTNFAVSSAGNFAGGTTSSPWSLMTVFDPILQMLNGYIFYLSYSYLLLMPTFKAIQATVMWFLV